MSLSFMEVYGFSVGAGGLTNFAPLLGIWAAMLYCGVLSDRMFMRKVGKVGPKPPPEERLPLLIFSAILGIVGTALFGGCTQQQCPWIAPEIGSFGSTWYSVSSIKILH
jgi:hypothetical protein